MDDYKERMEGKRSARRREGGDVVLEPWLWWDG